MGTVYDSEKICSVYRENPSKFRENILKVHNQYRAIHGSPPLQIDEKLNKRAQQLAKSLSKYDEEALKKAHIPYGANVYVRHPHWKMLPEEPVQYWYQENRYYNYDAPRPRNLKYVRNFTQLVWKDSKLMGIGIVTGWNGKVYLVCSYDPAANVDGEFQRNIAPAKEKDVPISSLEEPELEFAERDEKVVRSMERLYAVPSEKLRVWMVWLTGVSEIADEWHKWLRAHIDLIARIADLQIARNLPGGSGKITESVTKAKSEEISDNVMPTGKEERDVSLNDFNVKKGNSFVTALGEPGIINDKATNDSLSIAKVSLKKQVDESPKASNPAIQSNTNENSSTSRTRNNPTNASAGRRIDGGGEEESATMTTSADARETVKSIATLWPIGTSWQPLSHCSIERKADQMETIQSLKMPQNETERIEFQKNFTHQATLYGSYYKQWIETADQAVKEIAGRTVMTTAEFRGTGDDESTLDVAASQAAQYSMKQPESAVPQSIEEEAEMPLSSQIDSPTTDALGRDIAEASITLSDDQSKVVEPSTETAGMEAQSPSAELDATESPSAELDAAESPSAELHAAESPSAELDAAESPSAESDAAPPPVEPDASTRATLQPEAMTPKMWPTTVESIVSIPPSEIAETFVQEAITKRKAAEKLVRDMARAEENIPYFFYLKAEPDMDIAIRYNDEKVIPRDLDRESISANRTHLYFNLTDKPGRDW